MDNQYEVVIVIVLEEYQKNFIDIYLIEMQSLVSAIIRDCETIFNSLKVPETGYLLTVDYANQYLINTIIVSAENIRKLLKPSGVKYDKESWESHKSRCKRGDFLCDSLSISGDEYFLDLKVRNNIEHFDERIDKLSLRYKNKYSGLIKKGSILYNMSISNRSVIKPEPYYLKVYIVEEKTAVIDDKELNLELVYTEMITLEKKLNKLLNQDAPGGLFIPLK